MNVCTYLAYVGLFQDCVYLKKAKTLNKGGLFLRKTLCVEENPLAAFLELQSMVLIIGLLIDDTPLRE